MRTKNLIILMNDFKEQEFLSVNFFCGDALLKGTVKCRKNTVKLSFRLPTHFFLFNETLKVQIYQI